MPVYSIRVQFAGRELLLQLSGVPKGDRWVRFCDPIDRFPLRTTQFVQWSCKEAFDICGTVVIDDAFYNRIFEHEGGTLLVYVLVQELARENSMEDAVLVW